MNHEKLLQIRTSQEFLAVLTFPKNITSIRYCCIHLNYLS